MYEVPPIPGADEPYKPPPNMLHGSRRLPRRRKDAASQPSQTETTPAPSTSATPAGATPNKTSP